MQKLPCLVLLVSALFGRAWGQTFEVSVLGGLARMGKAALGSVSAEDAKDDDTQFKNGYSYGARLTYNMRGYYGHELGYLYTRAGIQTKIPDAAGNRTTYEGKVAIQQAFYNFLIYFMPRGERWRPYITGGFQAHKYGNPRIDGWMGLATRNYGANYGAGIKVKLFEHALVRFDVRDYITGKPYDLKFSALSPGGGTVRQQEASFGIGIGF
jgi:hypothetical protein